MKAFNWLRFFLFIPHPSALIPFFTGIRRGVRGIFK
jgi:hypothetical protein